MRTIVSDTSKEQDECGPTKIGEYHAQLQTLALVYLGSGDRSTAFKDFLDRFAARADFGEDECYDMFPHCGISQEYLY